MGLSSPESLSSVLATAMSLHAQDTYPPPVTQQHSAQPTLKLKPPIISAGSTPDQWSAFQRQWAMYKTGMAISNVMRATALFHCCDQDLMNDLMRDLQEDVSKMAELDLLAAIKRLAVKEESTLVHRIRLSKLTQAPGTPIRTFLATLRGQASLCKYTAKCKQPNCDHTFDYSDEIIRDNLIRGIADPEIMSDLLGDPKTDRTLDETVAYIAQKEQGKATRVAVGDNMNTISQKNVSYRQVQASRTDDAGKCWACGEAQHGRINDRNSRAKSCSAWSVTCNKCSVKGHFPVNCSKCSSCSAWGHRDKSSRWCPQNPRSKAKQKSRTDVLRIEDDDAALLYDQLCAIQNRRSSDAHKKPI